MDGVMVEELTVNELCEIGTIPVSPDPTKPYRAERPIRARVVLDLTSLGVLEKQQT
jgi:hypothetical protein